VPTLVKIGPVVLEKSKMYKFTDGQIDRWKLNNGQLEKLTESSADLKTLHVEEVRKYFGKKMLETYHLSLNCKIIVLWRSG
jgi:hypothetical protein